MAVRPWHALTLCDGYGGTELALRCVARVRTVCRVERDAYAAAVLVARMEESRLDQAPVWDDVCTFDGAAWRGRVDIVVAGFPCQPFSTAGQHAGVDDDRWLWPDISRVIADVGPRWVLLENVPQLVRHGLPEVLHDLAQLGFDAEWGLYAASAVGAPHRRRRFWLVAHTNRDGQQIIGRQSEHNGFTRRDVDRCDGALGDVGHAAGSRHLGDTGVESRGEGEHDIGATNTADVADGASEDLADTERGRLGTHIGDDDERQSDPVGRGSSVADTSSVGRWRRIGPATHQRPGRVSDLQGGSERMAWPPRPDDADGWERWIAAGGPQPVIRRSTDGPPLGLADALHLGGNGLVPQCAAEAWSQLIRRAGWHDQLEAV